MKRSKYTTFKMIFFKQTMVKKKSH